MYLMIFSNGEEYMIYREYEVFFLPFLSSAPNLIETRKDWNTSLDMYDNLLRK